MRTPIFSARARASLVLLAAVFAAAAPRPVQSQSTGSRAHGGATGRALDERSRVELLAVRERVWRAWFAFDSTQLVRLLPADGFLAVEADSVWRNREQTMAESRAFARGGGRLVSLEFPRTEMQVFGDVVVIYTTFRYTTERAGQQNRAAGNAVEVFVRRGGAWQHPSWYLDFIP